MTRPPASSLPLFVTLLLWVAGYGFVSTPASVLPQLLASAVVTSVEARAGEDLRERGAVAFDALVLDLEAQEAACETCVRRVESASTTRWLRPPVRAPSSSH